MRRLATFAFSGALGLGVMNYAWSQTQPAPPPGAAPGSRVQTAPAAQPGAQPAPVTQPSPTTQPSKVTQPGAQPAPATLPGQPGTVTQPGVRPSTLPGQPGTVTQPGVQPAPTTLPVQPGTVIRLGDRATTQPIQPATVTQPGLQPAPTTQQPGTQPAPGTQPKQPIPGTGGNNPEAFRQISPTGSVYPFGPPNLPPLFENPSVRKELNLNEQQVNQLNQSFQTLNTTFVEQLGRLNANDPMALQQLQQKFNTEMTGALTKVLQPQQLTRLQQLELQQRGMAAFSDPLLQKRLNLTPEQTQRIGGLGDQVNREMREIGRLAETNRSAARRRFNVWQDQWQRQLDNILTDAQLQEWTQMIGQRLTIEPTFDPAP